MYTMENLPKEGNEVNLYFVCYDVFSERETYIKHILTDVIKAEDGKLKSMPKEPLFGITLGVHQNRLMKAFRHKGIKDVRVVPCLEGDIYRANEVLEQAKKNENEWLSLARTVG